MLVGTPISPYLAIGQENLLSWTLYGGAGHAINAFRRIAVIV
jgi:hypothetical protein